MFVKILITLIGLLLFVAAVLNIEPIYRYMKIRLLFFSINNLKVARVVSLIIGGVLLFFGIRSFFV